MGRQGLPLFSLLFEGEEERRRISRNLRLVRLALHGSSRFWRVSGVVVIFSSFNRVRQDNFMLVASFWNVIYGYDPLQLSGSR